jgi:hypothetical protein
VLFLDPKDEFSSQVDIVVAFMPAAQDSIFWAGELGQGMEKQAIQPEADAIHHIGGQCDNNNGEHGD